MTLIALAGWLVTGCAADDGSGTEPVGDSTRQQSVEPVEVVLNSGWMWKMEEVNTLHVIRSAEELAAHVRGGEGVPLEVDFSRYSILFASGRATNGIERIDRQLIDRAGAQLLQVVLYLNDTEEAPLWYVALQVAAVPAGERVGLDVVCHNGPAPEPGELTDVVLNSGWEWIGDRAGATRVIRSAEELATLVRGGEGSPADVDFSRHAILYVTGGVDSGIDHIDRRLDGQGYDRLLAIDIYLNAACVAPLWNVAVLMPLEPAPELVDVRVTVHSGGLLPDELTDVALNPGWTWRMEERSTLHVIRTSEELAAHVEGGTGAAADVDFSRYSVLFASGRATNGIERIDRELTGGEGARKLLVRLYLNETEEAPLWHVALLVPAVPVAEPVGLEVTAYDGITPRPAGTFR